MPEKAKVEADETDVLDTMITSLAELLEEKGLIKQEEVLRLYRSARNGKLSS